MQKTSRTLPAVLAGAIFIVAACGDSTPTGSNTGDQPTVAETQELATELFEVLFGIGLTGSPAAAAPMLGVPEILRFSVAGDPIPTTTQNCEGGGNITVSGDVSASGTSATFDITESINGCVVQTSTTAFTVNSDPDIGMTGSVSTDGQTSVTIDLNVGGGISFTTDDNRSGTCGITFSMSGTLTLSNPDPNAISISGNVCGQSITAL